MLRIGLDIDNVLANFDKAYTNRFGISPQDDSKISFRVERVLIKDKDFWLSLEPLEMPDFTPTLYCSARVNSKAWTKKYLRTNGFHRSPLYQIPGYYLNKAKYIKGKVDVFIDDSVKNFLEINRAGIPCLLKTTDANSDFRTKGRVNSLNIDEIEEVFSKFLRSEFIKYVKVK